MAKQYTVREFAKLLGVSHDAVTKWVKSGKLKGEKKGPFPGRTSSFLIPVSEYARVKKLQNDTKKH